MLVLTKFTENNRQNDKSVVRLEHLLGGFNVSTPMGQDIIGYSRIFNSLSSIIEGVQVFFQLSRTTSNCAI